MKNAKAITKKLMEKAAVGAARVAAGTASTAVFHQPKEPKSLKLLIKK